MRFALKEEKRHRGHVEPSHSFINNMFLCQHSTIKRLKIRFGELIKLKIRSPTLIHVPQKINASTQYIFRRDSFLALTPSLFSRVIGASGQV